MQPVRVMKILSQCCQALAEAHNQGIIHRDIKPDNLYLVTVGGQSDFVKVLDFSVAKLKQQSGSAMQTQAGVVFGTPNYMSPEQGRGLPLDARSDIYALGIVAYEMLMGRPPFASQNPMEVLAMHVRTAVPPMVGVPDQVAQVVMRALAKDPSHRQQNVEQLQIECSQVLGALGVPQMMNSNPVAPVPPQQGQARTMFAQAMPGPVMADPNRTVLANPMQTGMPHQGGRPPVPPPNLPAHAPANQRGFGDSGQAATVRQSNPQHAARPKKKQQSSAALFWLICIFSGILIGVVAYLIVSNVVK